ncbi:SbcC/MukB-like Walker B domain-containing protein [Parabacteroides goldsteinii]|uniref:SbcC/MukB-like Walker B domain-containing protein n=1 Tax=Parabacteroides goldsteinii TaxID=328812 RepID=UPI00267251C2|nr:AAA family ATPase [Parabacteroides goldsteinii]
MKILAIRGRNLASLEGDFDVDFTAEPLLSAGIFAISGPTGAGKSTILDAMCLALFARTPRTDQAKENNVRLRDVNEEVLPQSDPRFLLRRGTASGYAEVDFLALNGHRYRSRWSVGRARDKENGRLQSPRVTLYNIDKEEEEQGTRSELQARTVELIGLTFEQFTRSVLLAQNDFSTFLKAEQGEKASLLEKLTGTELYSSISRLIFEKNAVAKEAYDKVQARIQGIELLTEEAEQELQTRLKESEAALSALEKAKAEQQALQEAVKSTGQQIESRQVQQKEAAAKLLRATELLNTARKEYEQGIQDEQRSEADFKALQQDLQQARKLDVRLDEVTRSVKETETRLRDVLRRQKEGEDKLKAARTRQQQSLAEITRLSDWRERYRSKESIAEQLAALLLHLDAASASRHTMEKAVKTITSVKREAERQTAQLVTVQRTIESKQLALRKTEDAKVKLEQTQKETDITELDKQMDAVRVERENLLVEQARQAVSGDVLELREKLQEGKPCPVCGSTHHPVMEGNTPPAPSPEGSRIPLVATDGNLSPLERGQGVCENPITQAIAAMTLQIQQLNARKAAYTANEKQLSLLQQQLLQLHKELTEADHIRTDLQGRQKLAETQITREEAIRVESRETLEKSLSAANRLFGNDEWQKAWQQDPDSFRDTLTSFARQWHENTEKLQQLQREQSAQKAECESYASFLPSLTKEVEEATLRHDKNRSELTALRAERSKLLSGKPADQVEQDYNRRKEELKERLKRLQAVQTEQSGVADQLRGISEQIARDLEKASEDLLVRQKALSDWSESWNRTHEGEVLELLLPRITQEKNEYAFRLRTQSENKRKIASQQEELEACRKQSERWAKLNDLAGSADGAKFRRIAQGYTLDVLLSYANVQLRDLSRRYRLERVPETLALQVIDRDMCDEVRTVHSLSGGESFLVSLALALGLSSLSSNRMKVESLFIDEGFGSLDADTLRIAMDALESLRTQGRKIGVISHVQEMTERIPVQIRVNRAGNGRSYLEVI